MVSSSTGRDALSVPAQKNDLIADATRIDVIDLPVECRERSRQSPIENLRCERKKPSMMM